MATNPKSVLGKIGSGLMKIVGLVFPIVIAATPAGKTQDILTGVFNIVGVIERAFSGLQAANPGQKFGPDKLKAALPLVKDLLLSSELIAGHKILDEQAFTDGCTQLINGAVQVMNSVEHPNG